MGGVPDWVVRWNIVDNLAGIIFYSGMMCKRKHVSTIVGSGTLDLLIPIMKVAFLFIFENICIFEISNGS